MPSDRAPREPQGFEPLDPTVSVTAEQTRETSPEQATPPSVPQSNPNDLMGLLIRFLKIPGHVLQVQGSPGAGKTTLALEILSRMQDTHKIYVSSRVSPTKLRQHFPWIDEVIDSMSGRVSRANWLNELHDLRRMEAETVFNQVLRLKQARQRALLVVDSWEGALRNSNEEGRRMLETAVFSEIDESKISVILVIEGERLGSLDYLVDGIVSLNHHEQDGRTVRTLTVSKMRGFKVRKPRGLFSLDRARFTFLPPTCYDESPVDLHNLPPLNHSEKAFSLGSQDLDNMLGGVQRGSSVFIDVDGAVPSNMIHVLLNIITANFINQGGSCFIVPTGTYSSDNTAESLLPYVGEEALDERVRIAEFRPALLTRKWRVPMKGRIIEDLKTFFNTWHELETTSQTRMLNVNYDRIVQVYGEDFAFPGFSELGTEMRDSGSLNINIASRHTRIRDELTGTADYHIQVQSVDDSLLISGIKPFSPTYGATFSRENGYPSLRLVEIV